MQCPSCGTWYPATQAFCTSCGDILSDGGKPAKIGHYRLLERIGQGGVGMVFRAVDEENSRQVAIKVLHQHLLDDYRQVERFRREAETHSRLKHPNILELLDIYEEKHMLALVMELLRGITLKEYLHNYPTLTAGQLRTVAEEVLAALKVAHEQHVTHRDIKPSNMFLTRDGAIKLVDFGLAKSKQDNRDITNIGSMLGSYFYMAPELIVGRPADARSDLYSLGISLYQMATGVLPFTSTGGGEFEIMEKQVRHMPIPPKQVNPDVPIAVSELIMSLLAKEPDERPQSCDEVMASLSTFGKTEPLHPPEHDEEHDLLAPAETKGDDEEDIPPHTVIWAFRKVSPEAEETPPLDLRSPPPIQMENLQRLRKAIATIPPLPDVWHRIQRIMADPDAASTDLAKEIEEDQPLAAHVLKMANSAAYAIPNSKPVTSVALALTRLGRDTAHDIMLQKVVPEFGHDTISQTEVRRAWFHGQAIALFSRMLSEYSNLVERRAVSTFGMLHDIGRLVILHVEPKEKLQRLQQEIEGGKAALRAEWDVLGYTHIDAGMMLALHWHLPREIHRFIYYHHHPCWHTPDNWPADVQAVIMIVHTAHLVLQSMLAGDAAGGVWGSSTLTHLPAAAALLKRPLRIPVTDTALYASMKQELEKLKLAFPDLFPSAMAA